MSGVTTARIGRARLVAVGPLLLGAALAVTSCATADEYRACDANERVGAFVVELGDDYTSVEGRVADAVDPNQLQSTVATDGACRLLRPVTLVCDPPCESGTTCGPDGTCVAYPEFVDVGAVTIDGLRAPVTMTASPPVFYYTNPGTLPHPGYEAGAHIALEAAGSDGPAFTLEGRGVSPLQVEDEALRLSRGEPAALAWVPAEGVTEARIHITLAIANHGGTPGRIECVADDTGTFAVPASLVDALLDLGYSGFPTVEIARQTADATTVPGGCVQLLVRSKRVLPVEIPGLVSCSAHDDCPAGQSCGPDLMCHEDGE